MGMKNFDNPLKEALHLSPRQVPLSWSRASMPTAQLVGRHHHYLEVIRCLNGQKQIGHLTHSRCQTSPTSADFRQSERLC